MVELQRWLLKTEPHTWSWQHQEENGGLSHWDGVRNAQAQKNLRAMSIDDLCFFYHSGSAYKEIVGIVRVCKSFYPDPSWSSSSASSSSAKDRSVGMVDLQAVAKFDRPVALSRLREESGLEGFALFRQPRLSVVPVTPSQWDLIISLSGQSLPLSVIGKGTEDELPNPNSASGAVKGEIHSPNHTPLMTCLDMEQIPMPSSRRKKARLSSDVVQEEVSNPKPAIAKVEEQVSNHKSTIHDVKEQVPNHKSILHVVEEEFPNLSKMKPKTRGNVAKKEASCPESTSGVVKEEVSNPSDVKVKHKLTANIRKREVSSPNMADVVDGEISNPDDAIVDSISMTDMTTSEVCDPKRKPNSADRIKVEVSNVKRKSALLDKEVRNPRRQPYVAGSEEFYANSQANGDRVAIDAVNCCS